MASSAYGYQGSVRRKDQRVLARNGPKRGTSDLFVTHLSANGQAVRYSSLIDGGHDEGRALTIDSGGYIYLTGMTDSQNYPMIRSRQRNISGQSGFLIHVSVTAWYSNEYYSDPKTP